jgi:hypothetical protein
MVYIYEGDIIGSKNHDQTTLLTQKHFISLAQNEIMTTDGFSYSLSDIIRIARSKCVNCGNPLPEEADGYRLYKEKYFCATCIEKIICECLSCGKEAEANKLYPKKMCALCYGNHIKIEYTASKIKYPLKSDLKRMEALRSAPKIDPKNPNKITGNMDDEFIPEIIDGICSLKKIYVYGIKDRRPLDEGVFIAGGSTEREYAIEHYQKAKIGNPVFVAFDGSKTFKIGFSLYLRKTKTKQIREYIKLLATRKEGNTGLKIKARELLGIA